MILSLVALCVACGESGKQTTQDDSYRQDSLEDVIREKEEEMNDLMDRLSEIQEGFKRISDAEGRVNTLTSADVEGQSVTGDIAENLSFIEETLEENRQHIAELQAKLKSSKNDVSRIATQLQTLQEEFNKKVQEINELKEMLTQKEYQIKSLTDTVASLVVAKEAVTAAKDAAEKVVSEQDAALNTAFYVFGTKDELKAHGILDGSKFKMTPSTDKDYFTKIDIREVKSIPLSSKKAEVLSNHPEGSYTLVKDASGMLTLNISDAEQFWSTGKYLVIKVK